MTDNPAQQDNPAEDEVQFDLSQRLEIQPSGLAIWMIVVLLIFGAVCLWLASVVFAQGDYLMLVLCLVLGPLSLFGAIFAIRQRRNLAAHPPIVLAPEGFGHQATEGKLIPWSEITGTQVWQVRGMPLVGIGLSDAGRSYTNQSKVMKKLAKASEARFGAGDLTVSQQMVAMPVDMFQALLVAYAAEHAKQDWAIQMLEESGIAEAGTFDRPQPEQ